MHPAHDAHACQLLWGCQGTSLACGKPLLHPARLNFVHIVPLAALVHWKGGACWVLDACALPGHCHGTHFDVQIMLLKAVCHQDVFVTVVARHDALAWYRGCHGNRGSPFIHLLKSLPRVIPEKEPACDRLQTNALLLSGHSSFLYVSQALAAASLAWCPAAFVPITTLSTGYGGCCNPCMQSCMVPSSLCAHGYP